MGEIQKLFSCRSMQQPIALIAELEEAIASGSSEKRVSTLKRVTGLFLDEADHLNDQQIAVFDDVLVHLVERIESKALIELSRSLAPIPNAPTQVIRRLANDDKIAIAAPVLTESSRLTESDLIQIAKSKGQPHLVAISGRSSVTEAVTDILVERGNSEVLHTLAANAGARFSDFGFSSLVKNSQQDNSLTEKLALRIDLPINALRQLLARATDLVRTRLLSSASPEKRDQIQNALATIANEVAREAAGPRDFRASESLVQQLNRNGKLNENVLGQYVRDGKYEETVSILALFCNAPVEFIERLMKHIQPEGLLVACKTARLSWPTVQDILKMRFAHHAVPTDELEDAKKAFIVLTQATAQRTFRFMLVQETAKKTV